MMPSSTWFPARESQSFFQHNPIFCLPRVSVRAQNQRDPRLSGLNGQCLLIMVLEVKVQHEVSERPGGQATLFYCIFKWQGWDLFLTLAPIPLIGAPSSPRHWGTGFQLMDIESTTRPQYSWGLGSGDGVTESTLAVGLCPCLTYLQEAFSLILELAWEGLLGSPLPGRKMCCLQYFCLTLP